MSNSLVPMGLHEATAILWHLIYLESLAEHIHTKHFSWLFTITFKAYNTLRAIFFLKTHLLYLFQEFVHIFLVLHLPHNFLPFLLS